MNDMPDVVIDGMDLLDPTSIDNFANRFLAQNPSLHILINNAGIMAVPLTRDARGYESQLLSLIEGPEHGLRDAGKRRSHGLMSGISEPGPR